MSSRLATRYCKIQSAALGLAVGSLAVLRLSLGAETVLALTLPLALIGCAIVVGLAGVYRWRVSEGRLARLMPDVLWFAGSAIAGAVWTLLACQAIADRVIDARLVGRDIVVEGRVLGVPRRDGERVSFDFLVDAAIDLADAPLAPRRLRLYRYGHQDVTPAAGETWRLTVRLRPLSGLRNAGGFDRVRYLIERRIDATGTVRHHPEPLRLAKGQGVDALRATLATGIERIGDGSIEQQSQGAALLQALTLGITHRVSDETWSLLRETGTAHLLAISGLHISLVAGIAYGLLSGGLRRSAGSSRARAIAIIGSLAAASGYALLAGFGVPVRRALVMLSVWAVAALRLRVIRPAQTLACALIAVLLVDPLAPLSTGFWLSFGTVAALCFLHGGRVHRPRMWWRRALAAGRTHLLLGMLLLPITAWFFQSGAWVAPLANIIAVPLVALVIAPLGLLALFVSLALPSMAAGALWVFDLACRSLLSVLEVLRDVSDGAWTLHLPSLESGLLCLLGLCVLFSFRERCPRLLALVLLIPAVQANVTMTRAAALELHVLDVGQGLAALVLTENRTWLYDTGDQLSPSHSLLEAVVVPYLHSLGRRGVDVIVVSHSDRDHAGGLDDALARWPAARVITGFADETLPDGATRCRAGDTELHDGVRFSFIHPAVGDSGSDNDLSCVLLVHLGDSRVLLTGDIEEYGEQRLIERFGSLGVSVLTAPHHGSKTSSSPQFVESFMPAHVVYPAGHDNRHRFPHAAVQMRYNTAGATAHVTSQGGAVRFLFGPHGLVEQPVSWRDARHRFWHEMVEPP